MVVLKPVANAFDTGQLPAAGLDEVMVSWQRSADKYRVDSTTSRAPSVLTSHEISTRREPMAPLLSSAQEEIDSLYTLIRDAGYVILFCDGDGVAIEHRGEESASSIFRYWGTWLGGVWSEETEGTNGVGTCIADRRPVTIHRSQHFRSRHQDLSCSGAPIFNFDGTLLAVLDVSAIDPRLSEAAHALTGVLTQRSARAIEERLFRERFKQEWIIALAPPEGGLAVMLLAVDGDQRILGADRVARANLLLEDKGLAAGISLWSLFDRDLALFRHTDATDLPIRLTTARDSKTWPALLTPPEKAFGTSSRPASAAWHARPRQVFLHAPGQIEPPPPARGGLPGRSVRRVREYIEAHLGETIDLATLAGIAGVSVFHFARQFRQSAGITPHGYIIQRRIEQAQELLARTDLSISEIAGITGFADQGHFGRNFRRLTGTTPREFRWSSR